MNEFFLHYVWYYGAFDTSNLKTTAGESVQILRRGTPNSNSGPDFFNAQLKIGEQTWTGNVEIHVTVAEWYRHGHQHDAAYNNTILHVVYKGKEEVKTLAGGAIPTLELETLIPVIQLQKFQSLENALEKIPCASHQPGKYAMEWLGQLQSAMTERLEHKATAVMQMAAELQNDWQNVFYIHLAKYLGFKVNAEPMEQLARITPNRLLARHKNSLFQLEALLFGQAGLLQKNQQEAYPVSLYKEYSFLQKKYGLQPLQAGIWKFGKLRPANFPTIRIAQLAQLALQHEHLFSMVVEEKNLPQLIRYFSIAASEYWNTHYRFGLSSPNSIKNLGQSGKEGLILNAVVPVLFAYGKHIQQTSLQEKALNLLEFLKPEKNRITEIFANYQLKADNACMSQGMLGQYYLYCQQKRCLECKVGIKIISE